MQSIHKPDSIFWIDKEILDLKDFLHEFSSHMPFHPEEVEKNKNCLKNRILEIEYKQIVATCGKEALKCDHQELVEISEDFVIPDGVDLETLRLQENQNRKLKSNKYRSSFNHFRQYYNYPPHKILGPRNVFQDETFSPVKTPDIVLDVQIYRPWQKFDAYASTPQKLPYFKVDQEFLVLGCQYLTELRDAIECFSDFAVPGECSDSAFEEPTLSCKDLYKSGFFYINGVFYNDMRNQDCRDYSETIMKWVESTARDIGPFSKAKMEETKFIDLRLQLGYPYVYVHQGNCEHVIVFCDLRLFSKSNDQNRNRYPLYVSWKPKKWIFCMVCHAYKSTWVVYNNKRLPETPFFFCKNCYFSFNYDKDKQKIGKFTAYRISTNDI